MRALTSFAAAGLAMASVIAIAPTPAAAETRIIIGGTRFVLGDTDFTSEEWRQTQLVIGANWIPGASAVSLIDYPASPGPIVNDISMDDSVLLGAEIGAGIVAQQLSLDNGPVTVIGLSQGGMVADRMLTRWTRDPEDAPSPNDVRFVMIGNPVRGLFQMLDEGLLIQGLGITVFRPSETAYDIDVIVGQYDGLADPPDRFWNLLALANSILGLIYVHSSPEMVATHRGDTVLMSRVVSGFGGVTSTYLRPTPFLPLTMPLRDAGLPSGFVDSLDIGLRPIIDSAYIRNEYPKPAVAVPGAAAPPMSDVSDSVPVRRGLQLEIPGLDDLRDTEHAATLKNDISDSESVPVRQKSRRGVPASTGPELPEGPRSKVRVVDSKLVSSRQRGELLLNNRTDVRTQSRPCRGDDDRLLPRRIPAALIEDVEDSGKLSPAPEDPADSDTHP